MTKILHCRDAGFDCNAVVRGETLDDILSQVRPHAAADHGLTITEPVAHQIAALVGEE